MVSFVQISDKILPEKESQTGSGACIHTQPTPTIDRKTYNLLFQPIQKSHRADERKIIEQLLKR
ncbi:MAG: hypothetical protein A3G39_01935 [Deltaproteobacteria bacterium RIFCSPLOWO2_12_FULL_43_16]|nr:MAG: hypothetical protein A2Z89_07510 [Deltaproteobacteria bacterium GWA2_43_19]OGQ12664.1 MAG: hypothetical protein A3D30_02305 [Deltaproteobacteria bacterium RIFCSPHIGHO2_02_FULL_43_33]OGQ35607.1 MAG: hypothetical protein A3A85_02590 [Deltaproteobacteria bacterium RIFCSPLOWO2_01_FULL_42_9]OGQ57292.1 MAG: hypothetical protein A3G39_01935 [Deltaproteobacteria bacterium RIFCSPLOWO2_12_FULL_43_16]HBR17774.1 hypothetical protein [Deltaproteobacteria bacterium]